MRKSLLVVAVAVAVLSWVPVSAAVTVLRAEVPFAFRVANTDLPAGAYEVRWDTTGPSVLTVQKTDGSGKVAFSYVTRLSARQGEAALVFDKAGNGTFLSEIYFPGTDGFAVAGAPGEHSHTAVKAK